MPAIHDTLFRQWLMIRSIPREPRAAATQEVVERLRNEGYTVTDRTVARDLDSLSAVFGYTCEERGRAKHWFWPAHTRVLDIPGIEPTAAMAWMMSRDFLEKSLPPGALDHLQPYFGRASEVLESCRGRRQRRWTSVFRVARRGPLLSTPSIDPEVYRAVSEALLEGVQLSARYRPREHAEAKQYVLHPLALVLRHQIYYLVATAGDYDDPVHFALHRMEAAEVLSGPVKRLDGFDLDAYVETSFQYPATPNTLTLQIRVHPFVASHLKERPLAKNQLIEALEDDWHRVRVDVLDSAELRWWLLGFGDQVVVDGPESLRAEFADVAQRLAMHYAT